MTSFSVQVSIYAVPYVLAAVGKGFSESARSPKVTEMYRAAVKKDELERTQADTVDARIKDNPNGFTVVRSAFGNTLVNYASQNRGIAANIMHFIFSTPRGSGTIPAELKNRIESLHKMLGLENGATLLDANHPVIRECEPEREGGIPRVFPLQGRNGEQTILRHAVAGSSQQLFFGKALGVVHI